MMNYLIFSVNYGLTNLLKINQNVFYFSAVWLSYIFFNKYYLIRVHVAGNSKKIQPSLIAYFFDYSMSL